MGVETRKSRLPAPTDSPVEQTAAESGTELDLATEVSRRTDKTSYTIPEDGREITIPAKRRKDKRDDSRATKGSQTSLLIEYFENGKVQARPSVRVKVTPSAARKIKNTNEHITVSESREGRKPSYTRRISLGPHTTTDRRLITDSPDDKSHSEYASATEESSVNPVQIDIMGHDDSSDLSRRSADRMVLQNPSEISSMPPDSMLEEKQSSVVSSSVTPKQRSRSTSREAVTTSNTLQAPQRTRSRSISKERLAHMAMEKIKDKSRERGGRHRRTAKTSRSRSVSQEHAETLTTPKRRSGKQHRHEDDNQSESIQSESQFSAHRQSGDQYSVRSGTSRSSINANTKLLETVEQAIKKIVMPELNKVKEEQKVSRSKQRFEQDETTSTSEKKLRKSSTHSSAPDLSEKPKLVLNRDENDPGTLLSGDSVKERKERRRSRKSDSPRERRSERQVSEETVIHDPTSATKKKSREGQRLRDASAGSSLTTAALQYHDMKHSDSRSTVGSKERRRRRRSKSHSRSASVAESEDVFKKHDVPPMPLQSDIHSSDITRDSLLSSIDTEGSRSPAVEVQKATVRQLARASPREISSPGTRTPTKGQVKQIHLQKALGTHHKNLSQEDLSPHSPLTENVAAEEQRPSIFGGDKGSRLRQDDYAQYPHDSRALSPIQSVSSRQESEANRESYLEASRRRSAPSLKSETSLASNAFDRTTRPKGIHMESRDEVLNPHRLRELELAEADDDDAVDEWLAREHERNEEYRSSIDDPTVDYRHMTNYTDDSMDAPNPDQVVDGQMQYDVDARKNPDYRGTPHAVESAVASLLDTSVISNPSKTNDKSFSSPDKEGVRDSTFSASREVASKDSLKGKGGNLSPQKSFLHDVSAKASPRQSIARSDISEPVEMGASGVPLAHDPMPALEAFNSDSDISTNPSIIRGPMAGTPAGNRDHWPYKPTPPQAQERYLPDSKRSSAQDSLKARAADLLNAAKHANNDKLSSDNIRSKEWSVDDGYEPPHVDDDLDSYADERDLDSPARDIPQQGPHATATANRLDPNVAGGFESPIVAFRDVPTPGVESDYDATDPFTGAAGHARHLSTNSGLGKGMGSPLYDSATGNGLDRIKSKDIVALMDHVSTTLSLDIY